MTARKHDLLSVLRRLDKYLTKEIAQLEKVKCHCIKCEPANKGNWGKTRRALHMALDRR